MSSNNKLSTITKNYSTRVLYSINSIKTFLVRTLKFYNFLPNGQGYKRLVKDVRRIGLILKPIRKKSKPDWRSFLSSNQKQEIAKNKLKSSRKTYVDSKQFEQEEKPQSINVSSASGSKNEQERKIIQNKKMIVPFDFETFAFSNEQPANNKNNITKKDSFDFFVPTKNQTRQNNAIESGMALSQSEGIMTNAKP